MEFLIQICSAGLIIPLQLLVIATLLRGPYRQFPFVFIYAVAAFLTTAVETPAYIAYYANKSVPGHRAAYLFLEKVYWLDEIILEVLVFAAVISLLYYATAALPSRRMLRFALVIGVVLFASASYAIHRGFGEFKTPWMTLWSRDLNVCATILDLGLWMLLLGAKSKNGKLLIISGALGVMFAGEAISSSLRNMARHYSRASFLGQSLWLVGDVAGVFGTATFLFFLWQTFRLEVRALKTAHTAEDGRVATRF